jgi:predicted DNA-binding protein (MmcQ/YjbR family)
MLVRHDYPLCYGAGMTLSAERVRELVAALADALEGAHHGHPDFRVRGKIFATLSENEDRAALRLTAVEARALAQRSAGIVRLVSAREPIGWVSVPLDSAEETEFADLLEEAYQLRASEAPTRKRKRE